MLLLAAFPTLESGNTHPIADVYLMFLYPGSCLGFLSAGKLNINE
jgi:hypothetical protein